ncbi:transposase [Hymenobacter tibetensis]|uniref:Transposase n=1 Tax=Hymenobacter tibetensis TaxID=497967 RepID=A0ABY4CSY0_9BACT|nr:transposase [Hymenobacter tibetensis]UOG73354.1 transposase [Hymenobacter tibetensis]
MNYHCSLAVDTAHGVISHVQADLADIRDCVYLPKLVTHLRQRLLAQGVPLQDLVADTNYSTGVNYALLEQQGITPWIPVFGNYKLVVEGFPYDAQADCFTCPAGKFLPFRSYETSLDGGLFKPYRASTRDCRLCPRKAIRAPKTNKRKVTRTAYDPHYRRALARQQSR